LKRKFYPAFHFCAGLLNNGYSYCSSVEHPTFAEYLLNMSPILPQYQRLANHDEEVFDSWRKSPVAKDGEDAQLPTYPPREGSGSGSGSGQSIVTFIFVPRYPVKGKKESVLGVMGRDKEVGSVAPYLSF